MPGSDAAALRRRLPGRRRTIASIMAGDTRAGARAYGGIKKQVLAGELRVRERLDVNALAKDLRVSATPVRQALTLLVAERLVGVDRNRGFFVRLWSEAELKALYEWRAILALAAAPSSQGRIDSARERAPSGYPEAIAFLFKRLAAHASNEVRLASVNADERLWAARAVETEVIADAAAELVDLEEVIASGELRPIQTRLRRYHRRRIDLAGAIRARAALRGLPKNDE